MMSFNLHRSSSLYNFRYLQKDFIGPSTFFRFHQRLFVLKELEISHLFLKVPVSLSKLSLLEFGIFILFRSSVEAF